VRTFNLGAVLFDENFEGYRNSDELAESWIPSGSATLSLEHEDYSISGQRHHAALTFAGAAGSAGIASAAVRFDGVYIPSEATLQVAYTMGYRYKVDASLAGMGLTVRYAHSFFGGSSAITPVCDGEWHTVTAAITDFPESVLGSGWSVTTTDVPDAGVFRIDDITLTRTSQLARVIDNEAPICAFRWNGEGGLRETLSYKTRVLTARDGSEAREQLRLFPRQRVEYEIRSENAPQSARIDAWLWQHHGKRVAVPRWVDAVPLGTPLEPGDFQIFVDTPMDDRWFAPFQRILLWTSPTVYEAVQIEQTFSSTLIQLDVNVNTVTMNWAAGTKVVPLMPARLDAELALTRPSPALGIIPLAFDVEVVQ
jgi:hypothetical protein